MNPTDLARARIAPRWNAAFREPRFCYELSAGGQLMPFTIEQSAAIQGGATTIQLGSHIEAVVSITRTHVTVDGNTHRLVQAKVPPQILTISCDHDSSHMNVQTILNELEVLTGIKAGRWMIEVNESGRADVHVAPSDAFVAPEIRQRSITDYSSLAQWLIKYNVKATIAQLQQVFGTKAKLLGPDVPMRGTDDTVLAPFMAPMTVVLHRKNARVRRLNVLGTTSVRDVLAAAGTQLYLHGMPLMPFNDVGVWRCCYYNNKELNLYDYPHPLHKVQINTLAGLLEVPRVRAPKAFVPYPTLSGNMFGDRAVQRPMAVAQAVPPYLTREWLVALNASNDFIGFDHAVLLLEVLTQRFGRDQTLAVMRTMMEPQQFEILRANKVKQSFLRRRYVSYVRCIMDLVNGTQLCPTMDVCFQGKSFPVTPTMRWSQLLRSMPRDVELTIQKPLTATAAAMLNVVAAGGDFLLEELRTNKVTVTVSQR